jgi:hypothetical protein
MKRLFLCTRGRGDEPITGQMSQLFNHLSQLLGPMSQLCWFLFWQAGRFSGLVQPAENSSKEACN